MLEAWRIVKKKHRQEAFSGEGASRYGGRWNYRGTPVVYSSQSQALAALELLVHLRSELKLDFVVFKIEFQPSHVEYLPLNSLPSSWRKTPCSPDRHGLGKRTALSPTGSAQRGDSK